MKSRKGLKYILLTLLLSISASGEILTLSNAYNLALQNSKNIKASKYQIEANREQLTQAEAELYPKVYFSASYGKKEYDGARTGRLSNYSLTFSESIYDAKKIKGVEIAKSKVELDNFKVEFQKQELAETLFRIYMDILKSKSKIELYGVYISRDEKRVELLSKKLELALGTKTDLLQGKVNYHFSIMDLRREKKFVRVNKLKLKHLTGVDSIEIPNIDFDRLTDEVVYRMRDAVVNGAEELSSNLKLEQSRVNLELSSKEIERAESAHLPTISVNAQYSKINADSAVSSLENTKSIMVQVEMPIYQGGATESKVTASKLSYSSARESFLQVEEEIREEYEANFATFDSSSKSLKLYRESLESATAYLDSIQQSFNAGLKSILDLNDAKSKLYEVKYRFVENIYDLINSYVSLLLITNSFENLELLDETEQGEEKEARKKN